MIKTPTNTNTHCSVEISHIYLDQIFSKEQIDSIEILKNTSDTWDFSFETVVLLDDYNIEKIKTSPLDVIKKLSTHGVNPEHWALEKDLVKYAEEFLDKYVETPRVHRQYTSYIEREGKYPCSLLTSIWYLIRLGHIKDSKKIIHSKKGRVFKPSKKIINILPEYLEPVEKTTSKLIKATAFSSANSSIKNIYYPSRPKSDKFSKRLV